MIGKFILAQLPVLSTNDTRDFYTFFQYINNTASEGLFFPLVLLAIFAIAFIGSLAEGRSASRGWTFSSFVCSVLAVLLTLMGFLGRNYMYLLVLMTAFGILWIKLEDGLN